MQGSGREDFSSSKEMQEFLELELRFAAMSQSPPTLAFNSPESKVRRLHQPTQSKPGNPALQAGKKPVQASASREQTPGKPQSKQETSAALQRLGTAPKHSRRLEDESAALQDQAKTVRLHGNHRSVQDHPLHRSSLDKKTASPFAPQRTHPHLTSKSNVAAILKKINDSEKLVDRRPAASHLDPKARRSPNLSFARDRPEAANQRTASKQSAAASPDRDRLSHTRYKLLFKLKSFYQDQLAYVASSHQVTQKFAELEMQVRAARDALKDAIERDLARLQTAKKLPDPLELRWYCLDGLGSPGFLQDLFDRVSKSQAALGLEAFTSDRSVYDLLSLEDPHLSSLHSPPKTIKTFPKKLQPPRSAETLHRAQAAAFLGQESTATDLHLDDQLPEEETAARDGSVLPRREPAPTPKQQPPPHLEKRSSSIVHRFMKTRTDSCRHLAPLFDHHSSNAN